MNKLDNLLLDTQKTISFEFGKLIKNLEIQSNSSFVALAAPSLDGKTQSAFVFEHVRPLYFALNASDGDSFIVTQQVYQNFESLSSTIKRCARLDLDLINIESILLNGSVRISSNSLRTDFNSLHLSTLGFLVYLVNDAKLNYHGDVPWMQFHAQRKEEEVTFLATRIIDLKLDFFKGYCLFIDEFVAKDWGIYLRNLARAVGLRCVVSNTNTRITNLTGKAHSSRGEGINIWSIVFNRLNSASWNALNVVYNLDNSINEILRIGVHDPAIKEFLNNFKNVQFNNLRPGVAVLVAQAFKEFIDENAVRRFCLGDLLNFLFISISKKIQIRKLQLTEFKGSLGNIGLMTPYPYSSKKILEEESIFHMQSFLENHFYYILNPSASKSNDCLFLTFAPREGCDNLQILKYESLTDWNQEYTHFKSEELISILSCLFVPFKKSTSATLNDALMKLKKKPEAVSDTINPNAKKRPGNPLEVASVVSIIDASHFSRVCSSSPQVPSLYGQNGKDFLINLIAN